MRSKNVITGVIMEYNVEVCVKESQSKTEKGRILEDLTAQILKQQQYEISKTVRVTGMEIDVLAKHKITGQNILVECKAWDDSIPADVITKLLGNVVLRDASAGWLVTTGPLSKDAKGIISEWETGENNKREKLAFYTKERIIDLLITSHIIVDPEIIKHNIKAIELAETALLMLLPTSRVWVIPVQDACSGYSTSVMAFDAKTGERIISRELLNDIKDHKNSYSSMQWLDDDNRVEGNTIQLLEQELSSVVPVISGDDWTDYRPARPEDFVGRKNILSDIITFFNAANSGQSNTRLFSIKAPSGMGKSSIIIKLADLSKRRNFSKKFFVYAVDVRTALSPRYAEMTLRTCFEKADKAGFTDTKTRSITSSNAVQYLRDASIQNTLAYLKDAGKCIILIFDQFEELFSKKELYPLFDNIRLLCNEVDSMQSPLLLGFAWKTDLTIPVEHPAYYMWANLHDRRKEFELTQFKASEIKSAINIFGKQLGEPVNKILANYLTKQCQGYPWLLKKLCIHVFRLIHEGSTQEAVIGQRLNIVDLFERDISDLSPDQHACITEIAKNSPADYFSIVDIYGNDIVQFLINNRLVIRRASKLTLYWDIFKDYVLNKTIPELLLDYIPQMQFSSVVKVLRCLLQKGDLTAVQLSQHLSLEITTIDNIMIDAVMFGLVIKKNNIIHLVPDTEDNLFKVLQAFFKKHVIYKELGKYAVGKFDYRTFSDVFESVYRDTNINKKTKTTYASKLYNWFVRLGLLTEEGSQITITPAPSIKAIQFSQERVRRGHYQTVTSILFWGQTNPEKMKEAYALIQSGRTSYNDLKSCGFRNALELLSAARGLRKEKDRVEIVLPLEEVIKNISQSDTISFAKTVLEKNPDIKSLEMGQQLNDHFSKQWTTSSKVRYGNAIMNWVKYLDEV